MIACREIAAAFHSLSHQFLWKVFTAMKIPDGFVNVVRSFYPCCLATAAGGSDAQVLFMVCCGVLQGCPLSGMVFATRCCG